MKCKMCNRTIADDSVFCPYCGKKVEKESPFDVSFQTAARRAKVKKTAMILLTVFLASALILYSVSFLSVEEPQSGTILKGEEAVAESTVKITAPRNESCVVKITGSSDLIFYIRAGETAKVDVANGIIRIRVASGEKWYGEKKLFGRTTNYSWYKPYIRCEDSQWEFSFFNGDFSPIDEDEFNRNN